jgi:hypothetical protein
MLCNLETWIEDNPIGDIDDQGPATRSGFSSRLLAEAQAASNYNFSQRFGDWCRWGILASATAHAYPHHNSISLE